MSTDFYYFVVIGFIAQLIDGALGMAYGVTASSLLLSFGVPPAAASATVHVAECFTTGVSALSHRAFGNIDGALFRRLVIPGVIGAIVGAYILVSLPGDRLKPWVAGYLMIMGCIIVLKAFLQLTPRDVTTYLAPLGFVGALLDAIGGGGWGPIVTSTLIVRGNAVRQTIGTVNAVEFFVTLAASITFVIMIGLTNWQIIVGLALGGLVAAPIGGWACKHLPLKPFMVLVGLLIIGLSTRTLLKHFEVI